MAAPMLGKVLILAFVLLAVISALCFAENKLSKISEFKKDYKEDLRPVCPGKLNGESHVGLNRAIVGGRYALPNEYPYATAIFNRNGKTIQPWCGSTLITDRHVVTARHCIEKREYDDVDMTVAAYDLSKDYKFHLFRQTTHLLSYPEGELDDIAIIDFGEEVPFGYNEEIGHDVYVAHLPGPDFVVENGTLMSSFGWGDTGNTTKNESMIGILKTLDVIKKESLLCPKRRKINICVSGCDVSENSYFGDSGSGLIFNYKKKDLLIGVLSMIFGDKQTHMQFMKISKYVEWLYRVTGNAACKPNILFKEN